MAKLTRANAKFHTNGPAKDAQSQIEIIVTDSTGSIVAQESNSYGPFAPGSTEGPFPIPVLNEVEKDLLQPGGNVTLNWLPVPAGAAWDFNLTLDLIFEDHSNLLVAQNGVGFAPGNHTVEYGL
jgi:hypothetical protein